MITTDEACQMSLLANTLKNKHTLAVLEYLSKQSEVKTTTEIYLDLRIDQTVALQSLTRLLDFNLVKVYHKGKNHFYSIIRDNVEIIEIFCKKYFDKQTISNGKDHQ